MLLLYQYMVEVNDYTHNNAATRGSHAMKRQGLISTVIELKKYRNDLKEEMATKINHINSTIADFEKKIEQSNVNGENGGSGGEQVRKFRTSK